VLIANKLLNKDKKQLVFAPSSLILTNDCLPLSGALACQSVFSVGYLRVVCKAVSFLVHHKR
jgi:hypothetical protein